MCVVDVGGRRVPPVTIDAAQSDRLGLEMRIVLIVVARQAASTLGRGVLGALPRQVDPLKMLGNGERVICRSAYSGILPWRQLGARRALGSRDLTIVTSRRAQDDTDDHQDRQG